MQIPSFGNEQAHAEVDHKVHYHPPMTEERKGQHDFVRRGIARLMHDFTDALPPGREKSLVMTHLEEAMFWANAAVARQK